MKAVFLVGGKGTRLGLRDRPKPMVEIAGRPLLERLVHNVKSCGFTDLVFLTGFMGDVIKRHFGDGQAFGVSITYVEEIEPLGTAGSILAAREFLGDTFVVVYGDILFDVDLAHLVEFHVRKGGIATLFAHPNDHPHDSDLLACDRDGKILQFLPKPHPEGAVLPNLVSGAIYVMTQAAIDHVWPGQALDWGRDVLPDIVASGASIYAYRSVEYAKDMGTLDRLKKGERHIADELLERLSRRRMKPAIFLDRDGVLNVEKGGVHRPGDLHLLSDAASAVQTINQAGVPAICVTNQPDIAKGFMTEGDLLDVFASLDSQLATTGAYLDDVFYCPHHPERGFPGEIEALKVECNCRKPKPGMLLEAASKHNIDLEASWLIGDRYADIAAAEAAGVKSVLVMTGHAGSDRSLYAVMPNHVANDLTEAVNFVLGVLR